ncbi:MAG: multicopper oxidase domain-containing protein [Rhodobacteraceae bacterium]|nr:multicopper oxidase domain-containing protein [Paracoccaceae bacterium]
MQITRRAMMAGLAGTAGLATLGLPRSAAGGVTVDLAARSIRASLSGPVTEGLMSYAGGGPGPVIRLRQGKPALIRFENRLAEMTTVHWHGLRVPHTMDGVAWVSQFPLNPGETFDYVFTPQDAGTFWYHPHCNTFEQLSRGLNGVLVVEEALDPGFDAEVALNLRDFRLGADGQFIDLSKPRNAARGGTLGTVMTVNWAVEPTIPVPTGGLVRLRLVNTDVTRVHRLFLAGAEGRVVALDGHPLDRHLLHYLGSKRTAATISSLDGARLLLVGGPPFPEQI